MKYGREMELILEEIDRNKRIFCNDVCHYKEQIYNRGYFRKGGLNKKQALGAFHNAVSRKYICVDKRFHRTEIFLTEKGKRRLERIRKGLFGKEFFERSATDLEPSFK